MVSGGQSLARLAGKTVMVTGATGFIGSHLVDALVQLDARVIAVAERLGWRPTVAELARQERLRFVPLDPLSRASHLDELARQSAGVEYLVHLAYSPLSAQDSSSAAIHETERNLLGTLQLVQALPRSIRGICFASSVMVYGPQPPLPVSEDCCPRPVTGYAIAKLAAEAYLRRHAESTGVTVSVLRYATVYGPMETVQRAVPNFIRQILAGEAPVIRGDGQDVRDYVHVSDVVRATLLALAATEGDHRTFNVGSGQGHTTLDIAERISWLMGSMHTPVHLSNDAPPSRVVCDIALAQEALGYRPAVALDDGLEEEIAWFRGQLQLWSDRAG